jgi:hypothetical protein
VPLTNVVVRLDPFTCTTDPLTKLLPLTVNVKAAPPAAAVLGDRLLSVGTGLFTEKVRAALVPPPGAPLTTVMERLPGEATSLAGIAAVSWVLLTNVVVRLDPFTCTIDPLTKLLPLTVNVKAPLPAVAALGDKLASDGPGLLMVKVRAELVPAEGVLTVIDNEPATARSAAASVVVNWVLLTAVVVRFAPLT